MKMYLKVTHPLAIQDLDELVYSSEQIWRNVAFFSAVNGCRQRVQTVDKNKMLIDWLESFGLLMYYCDVFISCLNSYSDGTHSLQK